MENDVSFLLSSGLVQDVQFNSTEEFTAEQVLLQHTDDMSSSSNHDIFDEGFVTDSREGVMCLTFEDTFTTDSSLTSQDVTNQIPVHSLPAETLGTSISSPTNLLELSELSLITLKAPQKFVASTRSTLQGCEIFSEEVMISSFGKKTDFDYQSKANKIPTLLVKSQSIVDQSQKKRGGWPKGRKRKPEKVLKPPKAPATGYVLYLNERRKLYKNLPFPEVTTLLGHEWTRMSLDQKQIYLDRAEREKKRYKQEFLLYKKSDAYLSYVAAQRIKRKVKSDSRESGSNKLDDFEDEDSEDLYCRICDQWFNTLHNKKEHLYGRQHLQNVSQGLNEEFLKRSYCGNENSVPGLNNAANNLSNISSEQNQEEQETVILRQQVSCLETENFKYVQKIMELSSRQLQANNEWESVQKKRVEIESALCNLLAVPALFTRNLPLAVSNLQSNSNTLVIPLDHNGSSDIPFITEDLGVIVSSEGHMA